MKSNMINTYIYSIIYVTLFISIQNSMLGMPHQQMPTHDNHAYPDPETDQQQEDDEQKAKEEEEQKTKEEQQKRQEEELKAFAEELSQYQEGEKEKLEPEMYDNLALLDDKEEKKATAIFKIPDESKLYALSDQEKARLQGLFKVYSAENRGQYKIIKFHYKDATVLPRTTDQAIYLLYSPCVEEGKIEPSNFLKEPALNQLQKKISRFKPSKESRKRLEKNPLFQALKKRLSKINYEGLHGSTKVKTESGYRTINQLKIGDIIACYDTKNDKETCCKVIDAQQIPLLKHIQIIINDQTLKVAHKHEFYIKSLDKYVTALDLKDNPDLRKLVNENIKDVQEVKEPLTVVRIRVDPNHNFYITERDILVHNFISIPFVLAAAVQWGDGVVFTWNFLAPTIAAITTVFTYWLGNKLTGQGAKSPALQPQATFSEQEQQSGIYVQRTDGTYFKADIPNPTPQATSNNTPNGSEQPSMDPDKDKNKSKYKIPEEINEGIQRGEETHGKTKQFKKIGRYEDAFKDFETVKTGDIYDIPDGKRGILPDGRHINVRASSSGGPPTLEIINPNNTRIKIRYVTSM